MTASSSPATGDREVPKHIAIVDPGRSMTVVTVLLEPAYLVTTSTTASGALIRLKQHPPDLLVVDVDLPDLDGTAFVLALRARFPACPLIAVIAAKSSDVLRDLARLPVDGLLTKPLRVETFLHHVYAVLPGRRSTLPRPGPYVSLALERIASDCSGPWRLASLASAIGVSRTHFSNLFKAQTGMTLKGFVLKVRIETARRLLIETDEKLDHIAKSAGFSDGPHLSRVFHRYVGTSPGSYRRDARSSYGS